MSMHDAIKNFSEQFSFNPEIKNNEKLGEYQWYVVTGMGGSHLAADLLKAAKLDLPLMIHKNYGLPKLPLEVLQKSLIIASSYSGNTEEVIDAYQEARKNNIPLAAISVGGKLLELARADGIPYIQLPDTKIQPRLSLGFTTKALLALMKQKEALADANSITQLLAPQDFEDEGQVLAKKLYGYVPVIYSSEVNEPIIYNWKIKFNETGKIPAFYNVLPELNHNEMTGFDAEKKTKKLCKGFYFIFLSDKEDHPRIQKRMEILKKLYEDRGLSVIVLELKGENPFHKIFSSLVLADWAAFYTAELYSVESEAVPMVEEFKKLISDTNY